VAIRKVPLLAALFALLAPVAAECQSTNALWRFVPPNAKALISINWERVRQSPAIGKLREKLLSAPLTRSIPGLDLLDEVDHVLITSPGLPARSDPDEPTAGDSNETPVLIAIHGRFEAAAVRHFFVQLGAKPQAYNSFQVYRPQGKGAKGMAWVQFDASTVLFGDAPSLFAALDRNQFAPPVPEAGSIVARAAAMEANYDFWISIQAPNLISSDQLAGLVQHNAWAAEAKGFEAGVSLRSGLVADFTVQFDSEANAKKMIADLISAITTASKQKDAEPALRDIAKSMTFASEGPYAKINLHMTAEEVQKSAEAYAKAYQAGLATAQQNARPPSIPIPAPPQRAVIRIEGLDSGTVEIPYQQPH